MKISEMITDKYKLRIPPTVYYDLLADVQEMEEEQEPTIQERQAESDKFDAAFQDGYDHGYAQARFDYEQEPILDRVRAEIEQTVSRYSISRERGGMGQVEWSDRLIKESEVLEILDKYKAEVEPQESEADNGNDDYHINGN